MTRVSLLTKDDRIRILPPLKILIELYPQLKYVIRKYDYATMVSIASSSQFIQYKGTALLFDDMLKSDIDMGNMIIEILKTIGKESNGEV